MKRKENKEKICNYTRTSDSPSMYNTYLDEFMLGQRPHYGEDEEELVS